MKTLEQKAEEIAQSIIDQNPSFKDAFHHLVSTYIRGWNDGENAMRIKAEQPTPISPAFSMETLKIEKAFLCHDNPKGIMGKMGYKYDDTKSHNKNCLEFLGWVRENGKGDELAKWVIVI